MRAAPHGGSARHARQQTRSLRDDWWGKPSARGADWALRVGNRVIGLGASTWAVSRADLRSASVGTAVFRRSHDAEAATAVALGMQLLWWRPATSSSTA